MPGPRSKMVWAGVTKCPALIVTHRFNEPLVVFFNFKFVIMGMMTYRRPIGVPRSFMF